MEIIYKNGNLLDATTDVIAHQVNCQGVMGSGVAKQIKDKWPNVFDEYEEYCADPWSHQIIGSCLLVTINNQYVANLFGQAKYGRDGKRYTDYEALYESLERLVAQMIGINKKSVAFPYKMSSDRGGADWNVVLAMIESVFKNTDITIEIWKYAV